MQLYNISVIVVYNFKTSNDFRSSHVHVIYTKHLIYNYVFHIQKILMTWYNFFHVNKLIKKWNYMLFKYVQNLLKNHCRLMFTLLSFRSLYFLQ